MEATVLFDGYDYDAARLLGDIKHPQMQTA